MSRPLRIDYPNEDLVRVLDGKNPPPMLGSEKFNSWIKDRFFKKKKDKEVPASKELTPDMETIISEVSRYYEIKPPTLKAVRLGIENESREGSHIFDSIYAHRALDESWRRFWVEPVQFCQQCGYAHKNKVAKR